MRAHSEPVFTLTRSGDPARASLQIARQRLAVQVAYRSGETLDVPVDSLQTAVAHRERLEHSARGVGSRPDR
jgi:hypothetical protein